MSLEYFDQQNFNNFTDRALPATHAKNLPPPVGTSEAVSITVKVCVCPSTPGSMEPADLSPLGFPIKLGRSDYFAFRGVSDAFRNACAATTPAGSGDAGALSPFGGKPKLTDMTDGTSNTLLMSEIAGRPFLYANGKRLAYQNPAPYSAEGMSVRGSWGDINAASTLYGYTVASDTVSVGGCSAVNVTNLEAPYSFHSGGVNTVRGDGSVYFLKQSVSPAALAAFITRAGGEVLATDN